MTTIIHKNQHFARFYFEIQMLISKQNAISLIISQLVKIAFDMNYQQKVKFMCNNKRDINRQNISKDLAKITIEILTNCFDCVIINLTYYLKAKN